MSSESDVSFDLRWVCHVVSGIFLLLLNDISEYWLLQMKPNGHILDHRVVCNYMVSFETLRLWERLLLTFI